VNETRRHEEKFREDDVLALMVQEIRESFVDMQRALSDMAAIDHDPVQLTLLAVVVTLWRA
jgi:hypothetical protein